jgi:hypothetical protein
MEASASPLFNSLVVKSQSTSSEADSMFSQPESDYFLLLFCTIPCMIYLRINFTPHFHSSETFSAKIMFAFFVLMIDVDCISIPSVAFSLYYPA